MNYEKMSDFEINKMVAKNLGFKTGWQSGSKIGIDNNTATGRYVDYCNNPSDSWPVIVDNTISITRCSDVGHEYWHADLINEIEESSESDDEFVCRTLFTHQDKNPLRAAMICFLKMKDAEK